MANPDSRAVTDRVLAQRELHRSEELRQLALDAAGMGTFTWYPQEDRTEPDERMLTLFGVSSGGSLALESVLSRLVLPEDRGRHAAAVASALDPAGSGRFHSEVRVHGLKDGQLRWVSITGQVVFDGISRRPLYMAGTASDVTERKQTEQALREREEQLRLATEAAEIGLWDVDLVSDTLFWPPRVKAMFGISPDAPVSMADFYAGIHPADRERTREAFAAACDPEPRALYDVEYRTVGKEDGVIRWVAAKGRGIFDASGKCIRVIGTAIDITARKRIAGALDEANRRKDEFLAMLAHELRNPLAPISNASELLGRIMIDDARARTATQMIKRQVTQLTRLVDDLLDVSRITQGRIELRREPVELGAVIAHALDTVSGVMRDKRHELTVVSNDEPLYVNGDLIRLAQCVGNLLTNAAKYTDAGGKVRVHTRDDGADAVIEVTDDGAGIAPELLPRVFDLFVQSDRTLDRAQGGLGIGLSIVRRLTEMHDGRVTARSPGPGLGSTFEMRLPRIARPEARREPAAVKSPPQRILIVDDNADSAHSLALLLTLGGHTARVALSSEAALQCAAAFEPQVALLDIGLPRMDGYELARRLRAAPGRNALALVALTGYGQAEDRRRALSAGFDEHLVKPVDVSSLERVLAAVARSP